MPKLPGLFDSFDNLDQISPGDIASHIKGAVQLQSIENYLASKILYPQTVPTTKEQMELDLAILREALRLNKPKQNDMLGGHPFLNVNLRKILVPAKFLNFVPDLATLVWAFIDGLLLGRKKSDFFEDFWTVVLTDDVDEIVGSVVLPQFKNASSALEVSLLGKTYQVSRGTLIVIPCQTKRCQVSFKLKEGKILGKDEIALEIYGGDLGLMIDGRGR